MNTAPQMDIADVHNEYAQQIATLSQRCAMLSASNGALHRANAALAARLTEMENAKAAARGDAAADE